MTLISMVSATGPLVCLLGAACSVTRPVPVVADAPGLSAFLSERPQANLRVREHSGRQYWVHAPAIRGDSLVGQRGYDVPVRRVAVPLEGIAELRTSHVSWRRTGALAAGSVAAAVVALALLVEEAQPTY